MTRIKMAGLKHLALAQNNFCDSGESWCKKYCAHVLGTLRPCLILESINIMVKKGRRARSLNGMYRQRR